MGKGAVEDKGGGGGGDSRFIYFASTHLFWEIKQEV